MVWGLGGQGLWKVCEWGTMKGWCRTKERGCTNCIYNILYIFFFFFKYMFRFTLWMVGQNTCLNSPKWSLYKQQGKEFNSRRVFLSLSLSRSVGPGRVKCRPVVVRRTAGKFIWMKVDTFTTVTIVSSGMQWQQRDPRRHICTVACDVRMCGQVGRRGGVCFPYWDPRPFYRELFSQDYKTSPYNWVTAAAATAAAALTMSPSYSPQSDAFTARRWSQLRQHVSSGTTLRGWQRRDQRRLSGKWAQPTGYKQQTVGIMWFPGGLWCVMLRSGEHSRCSCRDMTALWNTSASGKQPSVEPEVISWILVV